MEINEYLKIVAYIDEVDDGLNEGMSKIYKSKFDDSYITHVGMEDNVKFLADRRITEQLTHGVGYSPDHEKWYGWSHRAIYGFGIGSTCKKGDCHYVADNPEELIDDYANFFADISQECANEKRAECQILEDRSGIRILHTPINIPMAHNVTELVNALDGDIASLPVEPVFEDSYQIVKCGRGEWVAETLDDAKEMAIAFNESVA